MTPINEMNSLPQNGSGIEQNIVHSFAQFSIGEESGQSRKSSVFQIGLQRVCKRLFDILFASILFIFSFPAFVLILFVISITSPGPVILWEDRIGQNGKRFKLWKFRTQYSEKSQNAYRKSMQAMILDEEVNQEEVITHYLRLLEHSLTPVGKLIQSASLDDLPQLFNILMGQMSFVGPRPHQPFEVEEYKSWYKRRLSVKPGITSWSRLKIKVTPKNYEEAILYDLWYVDHWSFGLDLRILFKTIPLGF